MDSIKTIIDEKTTAPWCGTEPCAVILGELQIRPALPDELPRIIVPLYSPALRFVGLGEEVWDTWVRGHWGGCEIGNHWVRDALSKEDSSRSKNLNLNGNLAVLRCAVIALKARHADHLTWPTIFELSSLKLAIPYNLVCNSTLK